jgi:oleate hydratase
MSWTINRQPQFKDQPDGHVLVWVYGLYPERNGDYVKKPMEQCSGAEICEEWLYHMGVPEDKIVEYATKHAHTIPVMMPYITAFFMPREAGDRPEVVPAGCVNLAFIGQFANTRRDCVFTTEYSIRTGMEAVYTLLDIERGVPEVWGSVYDVRSLLDATSKLSDGKKVTDMKLPFPLKIVEKKGLKKIEGTLIETMLKRYHLI